MDAEANDTKDEHQNTHGEIEGRRRASGSRAQKNLARLRKINDVHQAERQAQNAAAKPGKLFAPRGNLGLIIGRLRSLRGLIPKRHLSFLRAESSLPLIGMNVSSNVRHKSLQQIG